MKKVFKDYLEVYVGSRGGIEDVSIKSFENIEEYLEFKSNENKEGMKGFNEFESEEEEEEYLGLYDWGKDVNDDYYLGLGDEECKIYIDMESEKFIKWKERNKINVDYGVNNIDNKIIRDLID
tara:strand:+ start:940 stop:1308 length:369 start_codon:yes stop_codon:yes gene_type:complete